MIATRPRTALLVGASGLVGSRCLKVLLARAEYQVVTALVRRPLDIEHPKLVQQVVDFEQLEERSGLLKADDVYCCLGTTMKKAGSKEAFSRVDHDYPLEIAKLAIKQGARQFLLVSAQGAHTGSRYFYYRVKGRVEEALGKLQIAALHIFRPTLITGRRREFRPGELLVSAISLLMRPVTIGPLRRYRPINASVIAEAMVEVALENRGGINLLESQQIQGYRDRRQRLENDHRFLARVAAARSSIQAGNGIRLEDIPE